MDTRHISRVLAVILLCVAISVSGCAWQRIPAAPEYGSPGPLPIRVGVVLGDTELAAQYGPSVVSHWKEMKLFESISYPYREGDPVDGVLRLSITGGWKGAGAGAGFLIGLTLGLASPAVGPSMTGLHDARASLAKGPTEVAQYSVNVETTVSWGMLADVNEVAKKTDDLQRRKIAVELARKLDADRALISKAFGK